jgi:predicted PurR-regulated permease PerM
MIVSAAPNQTLWFLLMYFLVQQVESSLIYPRILSNAIDMPSIWVLVAVTLGGGIMGVAGMLFLIPLFAVIYRLLAEDTRRRNEMAQGDMPRG